MDDEQGITPPEVPEAAINQPESKRMEAEMQVALIPPRVLFVPGSTHTPPTGDFKENSPLMGSRDLFAAVGMAMEAGTPVIWALDMSNAANFDTDHRDGKATAGKFTLLNLIREEARQAVGIDDSTKARHDAAARHQFAVLGSVTPGDYIHQHMDNDESGGDGDGDGDDDGDDDREKEKPTAIQWELNVLRSRTEQTKHEAGGAGPRSSASRAIDGADGTS